MKSPLLRDLKPNEIATAAFLVHAKEIRQKRTGEPYLSLTLGDRSGEMDAKMWDNVTEVMDTFDRDDFIKIKGLLQIYNNRSQLTVHRLRRLDEREVDFRDFFPASLRDPEVMWTELRAIVSSLDNEHIRLLLNAFLDDPDIAARYRIAPAAKTIHHAFRGGLLEHALSLCGLAKLTAGHYRDIDLNLMIAACVLHDIGKIYELSYDRGFGYSAEGQLLGHIGIGIRMFAEKVRGIPDFPVELRNLLEHMILSHHGHLEFGSPKVPVFPEALLFHHLDDMDSKMECMRVLLQKDPLAEGYFTGYSAPLERVALRKARYLEPKTLAAENKAAEDKERGEKQHKNGPLDNGDLNNGHANSGLLSGGEDEFDSAPPVSSSLGRPPSQAPNHKPAPGTNSIFGAKLQMALHAERK